MSINTTELYIRRMTEGLKNPDIQQSYLGELGQRTYDVVYNTITHIAKSLLVGSTVGQIAGAMGVRQTPIVNAGGRYAVNYAVSTLISASNTLMQKALFSSGMMSATLPGEPGDQITGTYVGDSLMTFGYDVEPGVIDTKIDLDQSSYAEKHARRAVLQDLLNIGSHSLHMARPMTPDDIVANRNGLLLDLGPATQAWSNVKLDGNLVPIAHIAWSLKNGFTFDQHLASMDARDAELSAELMVSKTSHAGHGSDCYMFVPVYDVYKRPDGTTYKMLDVEKTKNMAIKFTPKIVSLTNGNVNGTPKLNPNAVTPTDATACLNAHYDEKTGQISLAHDLNVTYEKGQYDDWYKVSYNNLGQRIGRELVTDDDVRIHLQEHAQDGKIVQLDDLPLMKGSKNTISFINRNGRAIPLVNTGSTTDTLTGGISDFHGMDISDLKAQIADKINKSGYSMLPEPYREHAFERAYKNVVNGTDTQRVTIGNIIRNTFSVHSVAHNIIAPNAYNPNPKDGAPGMSPDYVTYNSRVKRGARIDSNMNAAPTINPNAIAVIPNTAFIKPKGRY